ncbi:unnamed protein product [Rhizoctonia solani]|uniref:Uncharacterized protein n=1 Tax=Rhizoctonia solani TaxID=456999 RepID=A0A8H2W7A4_9AGAM|nr:unnamed protein product [Rhizoctonia solani]
MARITFFTSFSFFASILLARTVEYNLKIINGLVAPDGVKRNAILAMSAPNNSLQGADPQPHTPPSIPECVCYATQTTRAYLEDFTVAAAGRRHDANR